MRQNQTCPIWNNQRCCICGSISCQQSIDHAHLNLLKLQQLIQSSKSSQKQIDTIKNNVKFKYNILKQDYCKKVQNDQLLFMKWINQFYYCHLNNKVNKALLCQLTQFDYSQLPSRSVGKLASQLKSKYQVHDLKVEVNQQINEIRNFIDNLNVQAINQAIIKQLGVQKVVLNVPKVKDQFLSRRSISQISNPEQSEFIPDNYQWRNMRITKTSRVVALSNKNLKDQDLIRQLPAISCFKNIKQFQIRNNLITSLSCHLIVNNMSYITTLDIRGNKVGDQGIIIVVQGLPKIKSLLISETGATDKSGQLIADKLQMLQMLWAEYNQLTAQVALAIAKKPKVKVMSVAGNPIGKEYSLQLHAIFNRKGYIVL